MAIDRIKRAFTWMRNSLRVIDKTTLPGEIDGVIRPRLDVYGWERLQTVTHQSVQTVGTVTETPLPTVPEGECRLYFAVDLQHSDAAAKAIVIAFATGNLRTTLLRQINIAQNETLALERPVLVPPGSFLVGISRQAVPTPQLFIIRGEFITLDIGEYVFGSPYG